MSHVNCVRKVKKKAQMEMVEDVYVNSNIITSHERLRTTEGGITKRNILTQSEGGGADGSKRYRRLAVCVLLLFVLLTAAITVLGIKFNNLNAEKDQFQTSYKNMTIEKDQLQLERDQLQTRCINLTIEQDRLQLENDQLQTSYNNMTTQRDQLQLESNQFETCCNNVTIERDQLEKEKKELLKGLYQLGWRYFSPSFYYFSNETKNWTESRVDCRERGSDLVIINTMEEQEFISTNFDTSGAWIGLSYSDEEQVWKWLDDTPLTTLFWLEGELIHYEDCAITTPSIGSDIFTWTDYPCNGTVFSICEKMVN